MTCAPLIYECDCPVVNSPREPNGGKLNRSHKGTLQDLLDSDENGNKHSLNMLNIPMGGAAIPTPLQYEYVLIISPVQ
jgi:hypothetical protein